MYISDMQEMVLVCVCVVSEGQRTWQWMETVKETAMNDRIETYSTPVLDPRELHIEQIFSPNRFDVLTILKALNVSILLPVFCCLAGHWLPSLRHITNICLQLVSLLFHIPPLLINCSLFLPLVYFPVILPSRMSRNNTSCLRTCPSHLRFR